MSRFLDRFPRIQYDINKNSYSNFDTVTDLTFRFGVIKDVLDNTSSYYEYVIRDGETPEILADRVYGDPEAYWIILYSNSIYDPQYDWPMNYDAFQKYISDRYGSISLAKSNYHHYEKIVSRQLENLETIYIEKQVVDYNSSVLLTCTIDDINDDRPAYVGQHILQKDEHDVITFSGIIASISNSNSTIQISSPDGKILNSVYVYDDILLDEPIFKIVTNNQDGISTYGNLPRQPFYSTYIVNNKRVVESISRNAVSFYDYELDANEQRRFIKIIKKEYYAQIIREFVNITKSDPTFFRKLV